MKPVFIIAIVAVAMIGVMIPDALGKTYVNDEFNFSFNYPEKYKDSTPIVWKMVDDPHTLFQMQTSHTYSQYDVTFIVLVIDDHNWKTSSKESIIPANLRPILLGDPSNVGFPHYGGSPISYFKITNSDTPVWVSTLWNYQRDVLNRDFLATPLDEKKKNTLVLIQYGHPLSNNKYAYNEFEFEIIRDSLKTKLIHNMNDFSYADRITEPTQTSPEKTSSEVIEKSKFKKYSDNKYNFSLEYPAEIDSHFKGVDSIPMIWKNSPHPELPEFKVWKKVNTIPEGLFATTYEFKVFSDNRMSEYSQSELFDLLENSSINLFTDMCSPENCTVTKTDSNISTNGNGAKILDMIVQTVTDYEKGVTQYITNSMRITILNENNDVLMIQHITSSSDNFTHLFYEPHFTHMVKSLETQYIPKDSLKNTSTIFTEFGSSGGGCLIATATYGSELAPQVQQLRELRDNQLLQTESGTAFMGMFNDIYYSFSPIIADMEREHPMFKEAVKLAITPMISSLLLMENANSESEVLSIGISVIMLNLGMYLGVPAIVIVGIRKITQIN